MSNMRPINEQAGFGVRWPYDGSNRPAPFVLPDNRILHPAAWGRAPDLGASRLEGAEGARAFLRAAAPASVNLDAGGQRVIAHRGGGALVQPDGAIEAMRAAFDAGIDCIEVDCFLVADGFTIASMHDATVDRTTTGTGATASLANAAAVKALVLDPTTYLGPGYQNANVPTFSDIVRELGNRAVLVIESKNSAAAPVIVSELLLNRVALDMAVVQSFVLSDLTPGIRAGYPAMFLSGDAALLDFPALAAFGVRYAGCTTSTWTAALCAAARAAGIVPCGYTTNRRSEAERFFSIGGGSVFSDDPVYLLAPAPLRNRSAFHSGQWDGGMVTPYASQAPGTYRGTFHGAGWFGWAIDTQVDGNDFLSCTQHWGCPIKGEPRCNAFQIDLSLRIMSVAGGDLTRWGSVFICGTDDRPFSDGAVSAAFMTNGYHILFRANGTIQIFRVDNGVATSIVTAAGTALTLGAENLLRIIVTPREVTAQNLTLGTTAAVTDATHRGGFFQLSRNRAAAQFRDIVIS